MSPLPAGGKRQLTGCEARGSSLLLRRDQRPAYSLQCASAHGVRYGWPAHPGTQSSSHVPAGYRHLAPPQNKCCSSCTHSKYETVTPPALQRMSGIKNTPLLSKMRSASGVNGPLAASRRSSRARAARSLRESYSPARPESGSRTPVRAIFLWIHWRRSRELRNMPKGFFEVHELRECSTPSGYGCIQWNRSLQLRGIRLHAATAPRSNRRFPEPCCTTTRASFNGMPKCAQATIIKVV